MLTSVNRLFKRLEVDKSTIYSSRVNTNRNINKPSQVVGVSVREAIYTYEHCTDAELGILVHSYLPSLNGLSIVEGFLVSFI